MEEPIKKRMLTLQTRLVNRPVHKEFIRSTQKLDWESSQSNLVVAFHGNGERLMMTDVPRAYGTVNCLGRTNGRICDLTWKLLGNWNFTHYEFVGFLDDDAYPQVPVDAVAKLCEAFDSDPNIAATGPIGNFREWKRYNIYEKKPQLFNPFIGSPFATLGWQVYRVEHLLRIDIRPLRNMNFRGDVFLFMMLSAKGYAVGETPVKFAHELNGGLDGKVRDVDYYMRRRRQMDEDYDIIFREIGRQGVNQNHNQDLKAWLKTIEISERNHCEKEQNKLFGKVVW